MRYTDVHFNQSVLDMLNLPVKEQASVQSDKPAVTKAVPTKKSLKSLEKKK